MTAPKMSVAKLVARAISGHQAARFLTQLIGERGAPKHLVCNDGTEFISKSDSFLKPREWPQAVVHSARQVGSERVRGKPKWATPCGVRDQHWFRSLHRALSIIEECRNQYKDARSYNALGYLPAAVYPQKAA